MCVFVCVRVCPHLLCIAAVLHDGDLLSKHLGEATILAVLAEVNVLNHYQLGRFVPLILVQHAWLKK